MEINKAYHTRFQMHFSSSFFNPNHILEYCKLITRFIKTGASLTLTHVMFENELSDHTTTKHYDALRTKFQMYVNSKHVVSFSNDRLV